MKNDYLILSRLLVAMQDDLLDLIAGMQSKRMDEQRVALPHLPGLHPPTQSQVLQRLSAAGRGGDGNSAPDDTFLEMLMRSQVCPSATTYGYTRKLCYTKKIFSVGLVYKPLQMRDEWCRVKVWHYQLKLILIHNILSQHLHTFDRNCCIFYSIFHNHP
jgi:hypothetical protein